MYINKYNDIYIVNYLKIILNYMMKQKSMMSG